MMNISEQKAYRWLQYQGYKGIVFRARVTPDFITEDGKGFEVKKARNNSIWFSYGQFESLQEMSNTDILVYDDDETPIAIIPFNEIKDGQKYWKNIRIINPTGKMNKTIIFKVSSEELTTIRTETKKLGLSASAFIRLLFHHYFNEIRFEKDERKPKGGDA